MSRAPRGARGLKFIDFCTLRINLCRAPRGARGLKYTNTDLKANKYPSRPSRGAWIEIALMLSSVMSGSGRAPRGARGLKYVYSDLLELLEESRPSRGAWSEE